LYEQFSGYLFLEDIDLIPFEPRTATMDVLLGHDRVGKTQIIKQADMVLLPALIWERLSPQAIAQNFRYYERRTAHDSSLSPAIHALVAARLGEIEVALRYLRQTIAIDLSNCMGNAAGGVHAGALGGLWQAVVLGFGGLRVVRNGLRFAPNL